MSDEFSDGGLIGGAGVARLDGPEAVLSRNCLKADGFNDGEPIEQIAKTLGVGRATMYRYFKTVDGEGR